MLILGDVLNQIEKYKWSDALYLPEDEVWNVASKCLVLDPDDVEDDNDEAPQIAISNNLQYALDIQTVQGVIDNYKHTYDDLSDERLVEAFLFYYDNDSFI